jgi:hypothetical protein
MPMRRLPKQKCKQYGLFFCDWILIIVVFLDTGLPNNLLTGGGRLRTKLYDKRDDFNFPIVNFPFICSNIPAALVRDSFAVRRLFFRLAGDLGRRRALHMENSGFAATTMRRHISTFLGYQILFSIRNPCLYKSLRQSFLARLFEGIKSSYCHHSGVSV